MAVRKIPLKPHPYIRSDASTNTNTETDEEEDVPMEVDGWSSSDQTALQPTFDVMASKVPDEDIVMGEPTPPAMTPDVPQDVTPAEEPQPPSVSSEANMSPAFQRNQRQKPCLTPGREPSQLPLDFFLSLRILKA